jgi:hypothetical protein
MKRPVNDIERSRLGLDAPISGPHQAVAILDLRATSLAQQCFDVAMDQHRDIGLDPRCPFKFRAFAAIDNFDYLARRVRFARQKLDLRLGIGGEVEYLLAHRN